MVLSDAPCEIRTESGLKVADTYADTDTDVSISKANAKLIASAPAMYEVLQALVIGFDGETDCTELLEMIDKQAREVLAQAS